MASSRYPFNSFSLIFPALAMCFRAIFRNIGMTWSMSGSKRSVTGRTGVAGVGAGRLVLGPSWSFLNFQVDWGSLSSNIPQSLQNTLCTSLFEPLNVTF